MRHHPTRVAAGFLAALAILSCTDTATAPRIMGPGPAQRTVTASPGGVVISQVYGGGGNSGATLTNDFIELFNPGASAVTLDGWSVQYNSATGTAAWQTTNLQGVIQPGGYYLVQEAVGAGGTTSLPTPDAVGTIAMSATTARVALVNGITALPAENPATCPTADASVVDLVSYGATACGAAASQGSTATLSNTTAALRGNNGCTYTGNLSSDFAAGTPNPRNTTSPTNSCGSLQIGPLDHITIGGPTSVVLGNSIQLTATGFDAGGTALSPQPTFTWTSDTPGNVSVDASGKATGAALGQATITVSSGAVSKTVVITTMSATQGAGAVVISQLYGGGGNSGATFKNDFVELFNRSAQPVVIDGWSVQYNSANGTGAWQVTPLAGTIAAGGYLLVQEAQGNAGTTDLPTAQVIGTIAMSATDARVALVNTTTALTASSPANCPSAAAGVVDLVAYGTTACGSPSTTFDAPTLSATLAALRINGGCEYSANPLADFTAGSPNPRTAASPVRSCTLGPLDHISVTGTPTVGTGASVQLKATGFDAANNTLTRTTFTWGSGDLTRATVNATGLVTGGNVLGPVAITASSSGVVGSLTVTVVDPNAPAQIQLVSKSALTYPAGYVDVLLSTVTNGSGATIFPTLTWSSSDPSVATVDQQGSVLGVNPGAVSITATAPNGVVGTQKLTIEPHTAPTTAVYRDHLAFGTPTDADASDDLILRKTQYVLSYNSVRNVPNWVSWNLNATQFGAAVRCNCFSPDPDLPADVYHTTDFDYTNSGYDRGHMTMSEERTTTDQENATTYLLTNVVPQLDANNAGPWEGFENFLNDLAQNQGKEIYIIAGPQWGPTAHTLKGEGHVGIPDFTWKVAVVLSAGQGLANVRTSQDLQVIAVRMPNLSAADAATGSAGSSAVSIQGTPWQNFQTTVRSIEVATGYNLLNALPDSIQNIVETNDHAPVASLAGSTSITEGGTATLDASGSTDQDPGDAANFRYVWNFGDGSTPVTTTTAQQSHVYADNGTYTATLFVYDPAGASGKATRVVTVANAVPSVTFTANTPLTIQSGDAISVSGSFSDPGPDAPWTAAIDWGNGTVGKPTPSTFNASGGQLSAGFTYLTAGSYTATLSVTDKDGGVGTGSLAVTVARRQLRVDAPSSIRLSDNGLDYVDLWLYGDQLASVTKLDLSSVQLGTVPLSLNGSGRPDANVEADGARVRLRFSRQALIAAGAIGAATTNVDLVANLSNGIQIISHVPVTTTSQ